MLVGTGQFYLDLLPSPEAHFCFIHNVLPLPFCKIVLVLLVKSSGAEVGLFLLLLAFSTTSIGGRAGQSSKETADTNTSLLGKGSLGVGVERKQK